jgi:hypothetical protein
VASGTQPGRFFVRVVIVSGDEGSRTLYAFDLSEEDLRGSVIEPFQRGSRVVLGETSVGAADIREITISEVRRHVRGVPLGFLRRSWLAGHTERSGDWIAQHAATVTDRFLGDPASSSEMQPEAQKMSEPDRAEPPKAIAAALVVVGLCSIIATLLAAPGWVGGATIAAVISVLVLHRKIWRWPPVVVPSVAAVVAVAIGGLLGAIIAPDRTSTQPQRFETVIGSSTSLASGSVVSPFQLKTSLLAYDTAWGKTWLSQITVAPTDPIKLQLRLQNVASTPTPDLEVGLLVPTNDFIGSKPITSATFTPGFYIAGAAGYPVTGPSATIRTTVPSQSLDGVSEIQFATAGSVADASALLSTVTQFAPHGETLVTTYNVGILAPGAAAIVTFTTSLWPVHSGDLMTGEQTLVRHLPDGPPSTRTEVAPGDHLQFIIRLADNYFGEDVLSRVAIERRSLDSEAVVGFGSWYAEQEQSLGSAIVSSSDGGPITLRVTPNTTQVQPPPNKCTSGPGVTRLPDGVAEGGVSVGIVGGFYRARDPCHGTEFERLLTFDVSVSR